MRILLVMVLLIGACGLLAAQTTALPLTLAEGERDWTAVTAGDGRAAWSASEAVLTPGAGAAGISAPLDPAPAGALSISLLATTEGATDLLVQFVEDPGSPPSAPLWSVALTDSKPHRLAARLVPPAAGGRPLHLYLGARGPGTLRLSELALGVEAPLPPVDTALEPPLPLDWRPEGYLDAQAREVAGATELLVEVNGLQLSIDPDTSCPVGGFAPLSAFVLARGNATRKLSIEGEFPAGVVCDTREYQITKSGTSRAHLRLQGLVPGVYTGRVTASSGKEAAAFPVTVTVGRSYPAFGTTAAGTAGAQGWQLQELVVHTTPDSTPEDLAAQVEAALERSPAAAVVHFDPLPARETLRAVVRVLKGQVGLYGCAWRGDRPYQGEAPDSEAAALVVAAQELHDVVGSLDPEAACVSPVFDGSANAAGSPENRLLDACLAQGMGQHVAALVATAQPLPAGGVLEESGNGEPARDPGAFWAALDARCEPHGLEALMEAHDVALPILTSAIGGPAGADERLDALKAARALVIAAYAGATGATFAGSPEDGGVALTRTDGTLSPAGWAVRELSRELAGAVPILRAWSGNEIPGNLGGATVALPFVRGDEALIVLWNNTSLPQAVTLTLGQVPYSEHVLTLSHEDPFVRRAYASQFTFSKRAVQAKRQEVYFALAPLEIKVLRYRMQLALPTWVSALGYTPRAKTAPPHAERDDRPWWKQLQDWAEGTE